MLSYKIGIVGGAGFIGLELAKHLSISFKVKIIDVKSPDLSILKNKNMKYVYCDIRDYGSVKKALIDVDIVIHTAIIQIPRINEERRLGYEVNVLGTQNICEIVNKNENIRGLLLTGSWHTIGEREISGIIDEGFGYRPDKVEERAKLYALSKILQEGIVRFYDEMTDKVFGIIRLGTVLGERMPKGTAARIFIEKGLKGLPITPYKHSMYRPMLYVDIRDVCKAFEIFIRKIIRNEIKKGSNSLQHIVNLMYPEPITIMELAEIIRDTIIKLSKGRIRPSIKIVDKGLPILFAPDEKRKFRVNLSKAQKLLGIESLISPRESIEYIVRKLLPNIKSST